MTSTKKETAIAVALTLSIGALVVSLGTLAYGYTTIKTFRDSAAFNAKVSGGIEAYIAEQQAKQNPPAPTGPVDVSVDDDAVLGDANAPVTVIEFSDYECPFCGRFHSGALQQIREKYVKTGKVKFVYRDFPLGFHPMARPAALASECVREQKGDETFFKFHDTIFKNQQALSTENLKKWAAELGADAAQYDTCMTEERFAAEVDKDMQDGQAAGVTGTPATFVNGRMVSGAQPFSVFEKLIEEELNK